MESPPQPTVPDSRQIDYLCKAYRQQLPVWELLEAIYAGINLRGASLRGYAAFLLGPVAPSPCFRRHKTAHD
jgi:hypothetical protein